MYDENGAEQIDRTTLSDVETTSQDSAKFWLLSVEEAYKYVGKGTIINNNIPFEWSSEIKTNLSWQKDYCLRSPVNARRVFYISSDGSHYVDEPMFSCHVRPAFYLNF